MSSVFRQAIPASFREHFITILPAKTSFMGITQTLTAIKSPITKIVALSLAEMELIFPQQRSVGSWEGVVNTPVFW